MHRRIVLAAPLALFAARPASAHSYQLGVIEIGHPWGRPSGTEATAVFVALSNTGHSNEHLVGGATPIAREVLLRAEDGAPLDSLELLPHHPGALRAGRKYIALRGLKRPLALDDSFPLALRFDRAGEITITVMVEAGPEEE